MTLSGINPAPLPAAIDDGTLRRLAREPARPLFPLLAKAEAMVPLVVVFAFLPALYAVENRTLSETGAWEGLIGLRCFAAANFSDLVDPAVLAPGNPLRYEPPLASWLTALSMTAFGVRQAAGLVAPAYLCTAGLIVAGYILGRRLGGEALGLVTAMLLAFNPQVLAGAQEPVPQSAGCLFAVLALAGAVAHWQKSSAVMSYQLLLGGIALGLCLLTAGPMAAAIVVIILIYAVWWKLDARFRNHAEITRDRSQFHRRTAFRSNARPSLTTRTAFDSNASPRAPQRGAPQCGRRDLLNEFAAAVPFCREATRLVENDSAVTRAHPTGGKPPAKTVILVGRRSESPIRRGATGHATIFGTQYALPTARISRDRPERRLQ